MNVICCEKGHFYDKDSYHICPHCNPSILSTSSKPSGLKAREIPTADPTAVTKDPVSVAGGSSPPVQPPIQKPAMTPPAYVPAAAGSNVHRGGTIDIFSYSGGSKETPQQDTSDPAPPEPQQPRSTEQLQNELRQSAVLSPEKTVSIFGRISGEKNQEMKQSPVVGWLVSVSGPHIGQSFQILAGKNAIGRGPKNDIVLSMDRSISNENHAWVTYEPDFGNFLFEGGGGRYPGLNGKQVLSVVELNPYDQIELGETKLLFVNLCGENFSWSSYIEKES